MAKKRKWMKWVWIGLPIIVLLYLGIYLFLYAGKNQQTNRYRSAQLPDTFRYNFAQPLEELRIPTPREGLLNALLFKAPQPKGVVCFWKGNGGTLAN